MIAEDKKIIENHEYSARLLGMPEDGIKVLKLTGTNLTYKELRHFLLADPKLNKIEALRIQKHFLIAIHSLLPPVTIVTGYL